MDIVEVRIVNHVITHVIRDKAHHDLLKGDLVHPRLQARLREMAGIGPTAGQGTITVNYDDRIWHVLVSFLSAEEVELTAQPAPNP